MFFLGWKLRWESRGARGANRAVKYKRSQLRLQKSYQFQVQKTNPKLALVRRATNERSRLPESVAVQQIAYFFCPPAFSLRFEVQKMPCCFVLISGLATLEFKTCIEVCLRCNWSLEACLEGVPLRQLRIKILARQHRHQLLQVQPCWDFNNVLYSFESPWASLVLVPIRFA